MKGKILYLSFPSILGILYASESNWTTLVIFFMYSFMLLKLKGFTFKQMLLMVGVFLLFFVKGELDEFIHKPVLSGKEKNFTLTILYPFKLDGNSFSSFAKEQLSGDKLVLRYTIPTIKEKQKLEELPIGATCKIRGSLEKPNPAKNTNAFDYKKYLHHEHTYWILQVEKWSIEQCITSDTLLTYIQNIRRQGIQYIHSHFPKETAPLAAALIFGDRTTIEPNLLEAYQNLGIVHLLAISGLHVGMLVGLLFYVGLRLGLTREKVTNLLIVFLPIYAILTGGAPSVIRAGMMMEAVLIYSKFNRNTKFNSIDIIAFVFLMYSFYKPNVIFNIGFQLSFSVTAALLLSAPILSKYTLNPISLLIGTSFIAQLSSAPILLYHFFEFSLLSLLMNVLYVPLFSIIILPVLLVVFLLTLLFGPWMASVLSLLNDFLHLLNVLTKQLSTIPYGTITLGRPSNFLMILYGFGLPFFLFKWEKVKSRKEWLTLLLLPMMLFTFHYASNKFSLVGEVTMIDVGQGDSILIKLPLNKGTYLIDTGGTLRFEEEEWKERMDPFEVGEDVLVPFLKSKGITNIHKLILTHVDMDHIGGAESLLNSIKVKEMVLPKTEEPSTLEKKLIKMTNEKEIPVHYASRGDSWMEGNVKFTIVSPPMLTKNLDRNDESVVLYVRLGGLNWLFTGDLEEAGEEKLLSSIKALPVDVLKVGHHGSKSSTTDRFLDFLNPDIALISAGERNRFGHPHREVMERLRKRNILIFRTDENGTISYFFQGDEGTFFTEIHSMYNKQ